MCRLCRLRERNDKNRQTSLASFFTKPALLAGDADMEDIGAVTQTSTFSSPLRKRVAVVKRKQQVAPIKEGEESKEMAIEIEKDDTGMEVVDDADANKENENNNPVLDDVIELDTDTARASAAKAKPNASQDPEIPDPSTDFTGWLKATKRHWKSIRAKRRMERAMYHSSSMNGAPMVMPKYNLKSGLKGFLKQAAAAVRLK